ncbi:MAG: helix-turn-helix domain-containing protein, partial [Polyangia bacterium]
MSERLLSSAEVAELLGVSPASIKRWADAGILPCVKTAGQHRRFRREVVDRFRQSAEPPPDDETERTPAAAWADELLQDDDSGALE